MALQPFALPIAYGKTPAVKNSGGHLVNWEAEAAPPDARTPVTLVGSPGLKLYADTGSEPVLEMTEINNVAYCVTANGFYRIFPDGGTYRLGNVFLEPQCAISSNGLAVVMTDGKRAFSYEIRSDEQSRYDNNIPFSNFVTEITNDPNFYPSSSLTFLDGYLIFARDGTNQFFNTDPLTVTFDPAGFTSAESSPDYVVGVIENQQQLWVIGTKTSEVFYNAGAGKSPWQRVQGAVSDHGTLAPLSIRKLRNSVFWLDQNGTTVMAVGYQARPISTEAIEGEIRRNWDVVDRAFAFCYSEFGHDYYQLTIGDFTAVYDISTGLWHKREDHTYGRHRANCHVYCYGKNLVGSFVDGKIYEISREFLDNAGDPLVAQIITGPLETGFRMAHFPSFEIDIDVGFGTAAVPNPQIGIEISNDDGETFGVQRLKPLGKVGEKRTRVRWQRNGQARQRRWRIVLSDAVKRSMTSRAWIDIA